MGMDIRRRNSYMDMYKCALNNYVYPCMIKYKFYLIVRVVPCSLLSDKF